jgi:hypothetical protein
MTSYLFFSVASMRKNAMYKMSKNGERYSATIQDQAKTTTEGTQGSTTLYLWRTSVIPFPGFNDILSHEYTLAVILRTAHITNPRPRQ